MPHVSEYAGYTMKKLKDGSIRKYPVVRRRLIDGEPYGPIPDEIAQKIIADIASGFPKGRTAKKYGVSMYKLNKLLAAGAVESQP